MADLRPKHMTQGEFAEKLREAGFPACSKAAVSLAERSKESGVQFTPAARKAAQGLLNSKPRAENRVNGNKTTVWLDDELREWVQTEAYLQDIPVGEFIRRIIKQAQKAFSIPRDPFTGDAITFDDGAQCAPLQASIGPYSTPPVYYTDENGNTRMLHFSEIISGKINPEYNERFLKYDAERKTLADIICEAIEKAASDAATSEAAGAPEAGGRQSAVPTGHLHDTTKQEGNQA